MLLPQTPSTQASINEPTRAALAGRSCMEVGITAEREQGREPGVLPRVPQIRGMEKSLKDAALPPLPGPPYPNEARVCHTLQPSADFAMRRPQACQ